MTDTFDRKFLTNKLKDIDNIRKDLKGQITLLSFKVNELSNPSNPNYEQVILNITEIIATKKQIKEDQFALAQKNRIEDDNIKREKNAKLKSLNQMKETQRIETARARRGRGRGGYNVSYGDQFRGGCSRGQSAYNNRGANRGGYRGYDNNTSDTRNEDRIADNNRGRGGTNNRGRGGGRPIDSGDDRGGGSRGGGSRGGGRGGNRGDDRGGGNRGGSRGGSRGGNRGGNTETTRYTNNTDSTTRNTIKSEDRSNVMIKIETLIMTIKANDIAGTPDFELERTLLSLASKSNIDEEELGTIYKRV